MKSFLTKHAKKDQEPSGSKKHDFKVRLHNLGGSFFTKLQNLSRAIVLPIAVLPVAGLLLGIGGGLAGALTTYQQQGLNVPQIIINIFLVMKAAGDVVFANLGVIFAIAIAFGFAKNSKGVAGLAGFIAFAVMTAVINGMFFVQVRDGHQFATFDPWNLTNKLPFDDITNKYSGNFSNILGLFPTFNTSVLGGIIVGWIVSIVHNRTYNIRMPRILAFFGGERFVPILALFLGIAFGLVLFFLWPALLLFFKFIGSSLGSAMQTSDLQTNVLTGNSFKPSVAGAFIAFFFGVTERLLVPTGLHHVQYTPFWYTPVGGVWNYSGGTATGAYEIFFAQLGNGGEGVMNQTPGTVFMSGRFAFMQYGYPLAALAMYLLAKPQNRKTVAGILIPAAATSFLTGITEPMLFSFLFVAPLCFLFHAFMAGLSFMGAYLLNVVVGQGFAAGFIDFCFFGILPTAFGKVTHYYWVFAIGVVMAVGYFFGFYFIIKWRNYQTLGREHGIEATNLAVQSVGATLDKSTSKGASPLDNLLLGLGGVDNIVDIAHNDKILIVTLKDPQVTSQALIRLSGTKTIKLEDKKINITYLDGARKFHDDLDQRIANKAKSKKPSKDLTDDMQEKIFIGLGGRDNITVLDNCATRLRVTVKDLALVDDVILKSTGAVAVIKKGLGVQVIYGPQVGNIKNELLKTWPTK